MRELFTCHNAEAWLEGQRREELAAMQQQLTRVLNRVRAIVGTKQAVDERWNRAQGRLEGFRMARSRADERQ